MDELYTTTRRYARSMDEAFRQTADYACAVEHPPKRVRDWWVWLILGGALAALLLMV